MERQHSTLVGTTAKGDLYVHPLGESPEQPAPRYQLRKTKKAYMWLIPTPLSRQVYGPLPGRLLVVQTWWPR